MHYKSIRTLFLWSYVAVNFSQSAKILVVLPLERCFTIKMRKLLWGEKQIPTPFLGLNYLYYSIHSMSLRLFLSSTWLCFLCPNGAMVGMHCCDRGMDAFFSLSLAVVVGRQAVSQFSHLVINNHNLLLNCRISFLIIVQVIFTEFFITLNFQLEQARCCQSLFVLFLSAIIFLSLVSL